MFKALIIEDHPKWQKKLEKILQEEGYSPSVAGTQEEALNFLELSEEKNEVYLLITVDLMLDENPDDLGGIEILKKITNLFDRFGTSVIIVTASDRKNFDQVFSVYPHINNYYQKYDKGNEGFRETEFRQEVRSLLPK